MRVHRIGYSSLAVVIPKKICKKWGIKEGDDIDLFLFGNRIIIVPRDGVDSLDAVIASLRKIRKKFTEVYIS